MVGVDVGGVVPIALVPAGVDGVTDGDVVGGDASGVDAEVGVMVGGRAVVGLARPTGPATRGPGGCVVDELLGLEPTTGGDAGLLTAGPAVVAVGLVTLGPEGPLADVPAVTAPEPGRPAVTGPEPAGPAVSGPAGPTLPIGDPPPIGPV